MKWLHIITLFFYCVAFTGCKPNNSLIAQLQDYQARLANVLDSHQPKFKKVTLPPYPKLREFDEQDINDTKIKLFEFYQLKHCRLYSLVAERNTTLGRVQLPSTRYLYERNLLQALNECIQNTEDKVLLDKLTNWQHTKIQNSPHAWADLVQKSTETKNAFSANQSYITATEKDGLGATLDALHYLLNIEQNQALNSQRLEKNLQQLQHYALPAKLWLSQKVIIQYLNQSTLWLEQHNYRLKCRNGRAEEKVEYLANVFQRYFIEKIQPTSSKMNDYQYQLQPLFQKLSENSALSSKFKSYIKELNQTGFEQYQLAVKQHIQFWQKLYKRCNIQPGNR